MKKTIRFLLFMVIITLSSTVLAFFASAEAGDSYTYAQTINVNQYYSDNISDNKDIDFYKITLPSSGSVYINFKRANLYDANKYWTLSLYNQDTDFITDYSCSGNITEDNTHKVGLDAGTYYIKISYVSWYGAGGYGSRYSSEKYTFNIKFSESSYWEKENNGEYATANYLNLNKEYNASICEETDIDFYKFSLSAEGYIYFNFKSKNLYNNADYWAVSLYNNKTELITDYYFKGNVTETSTYKIGLNAGTYYVKITGVSWYGAGGYGSRYSTENYRFIIKYTKSLYWEKEINNDYNSANKISLSKTYNASLSEDNDIDYYKFTVSEKLKLTINFKSNIQNDVSEYYTVTLFDSKTNEIGYFSIYGNKTNTRESITLDKGTYYIRIRGGNWYGGYSQRYSTDDYSFSVSNTPPAITSKITATQSTSVIKLNWNAVSGATGYRVYQYSPSKGKYVHIASVKATTYRKAKNLKPGTTYKFKIKAYKKLSDGTVIWGDASSAFATATECKAPKITSVTSPSKSKATVKWSNVEGETGYHLYYSTKKTSGYKKINSYSANKLTGSKTFSSSASGKTIYFKVRAYKKVNGQTIYSEWSAVKSVKLK